MQVQPYRHRYQACAILIVSLLGLATSCSDELGNTSVPATYHELLPAAEDLGGYEFVQKGVISEEALVQLHTFARGLAMASGDPTLRATIRDAMRASPHDEHKLVLSEFVKQSRTREVLKQAFQQRAALNDSDLDLALRLIPEMDFYLPWTEHRQSWRATPDLLVAVTLDVNNPQFDAYDGLGQRTRMDASEGLPTLPILFLHPVERKFPRLDITSGAGDVVEDPAPSEPSRGPIVGAQDCDVFDPNCGGSGGSTRLVLRNFEYFYDGDAIGRGEIEFPVLLIRFFWKPYQNRPSVLR